MFQIIEADTLQTTRPKSILSDTLRTGNASVLGVAKTHVMSQNLKKEKKPNKNLLGVLGGHSLVVEPFSERQKLRMIEKVEEKLTPM